MTFVAKTQQVTQTQHEDTDDSDKKHYKLVSTLSFYKLYEYLNANLLIKYSWFLVINILITCETFIIIAPISLPSKDLAKFGLRFTLRFCMPLCLWSSLERLARQFRCCYHTDCKMLSICTKNVNTKTYELDLIIELLLSFIFLVVLSVFGLTNGLPGRKELQEVFPPDTLPYVYIADGSCLLFIALQIQLTIALMVFESKHVHHSSCPDTTVKRWSRIKGTIVVTTLGLFASAFARLFFNKRSTQTQVLTHLNWDAIIGGGIMFLCTNSNRLFRVMASIALVVIMVFGNSETAADADLVHSVVNLGACGVMYNMISGGKMLYLWSDRFQNILYQLVTVTVLAVIAADLQH